MNTPNNSHEIDPFAQTMRISLRETNAPTERHGLYALILEKADVMLERAGGADLLIRLMFLPSGATLAALAVGAIFRTLKLTH